MRKNKFYTNKHRRKNLCNEIMVLKTMDHKNILKLIKVFEDRVNIYLVMEYIKGMPLFKYLKERKTSGLNELEAKFLFKEILSALVYWHTKSVAHRDVKLENIIVINDLHDDTNPNIQAPGIKLIDFGFAVKYQKYEKSSTYCGTPSYMAPEIVKRIEFDYELGDVWACGVVFYALLSGQFPFKGITNKDLYSKI